jgi:hypothetical protein
MKIEAALRPHVAEALGCWIELEAQVDEIGNDDWQKAPDWLWAVAGADVPGELIGLAISGVSKRHHRHLGWAGNEKKRPWLAH